MRGHAFLTIQPSKARNHQKVKIPFVNKIELFDCETWVHGIYNTWLAVSSPASCQCLFSGEFQQGPAIAESILKIRVYHCWPSGWVTRSLSQDCFLKPGLYFSFWEIIKLHHSSLVILFCDFSLKVSEFFVAV